ncbi:MAG: flagellar motor switch protein FliG [Methylobacteriaceae bacterium]|jgi:flagellar motor switch protein FliG|uniref:Flagellar motor switch protein FliG n=3 Tax=Methylorubrum extorquens TaxID=408 RepID=C5AT95_METEA|nr:MULTISPECIES: flagellar motor switch protein FliG [Methylorubrum]KQO92142.1 flagellar motor switch protein FliG [Methylobacterium sp. Leaf90]KQP91478.1 flagellar motor switch protein FliG [Methylobacterium sp. Leaf119]MBA9070924.1 flagellar motor switch protein FliG [Methylobacterium sp. RAS18]ABY29052.1 flagellar motor switch protein FliG [Methylorubrum extorquens PA1]ACS38405.1 flagellar motor switch protein FliG [Methylorubrum extorquens AM1]
MSSSPLASSPVPSDAVSSGAVAPRAVATRRLEPVDQVAALLLAMGKPAAGRLIKYFEPDELKRITRSASNLGAVSPEQLDTVVEHFSAEFSAGNSLIGTASEVEKLLSGLLPADQIADILADVRGSATRSVWDRLGTVQESVLASYLVKEHPQTAALILSKVKPATAAKVMGHLPAPVRNTVMRRMLSFKPIVDDVLHAIEKTLHEDFMINGARNSGADTHAKMADIINKMERQQMDDVLSSLGESRPKSVEILKGLLFTFDDIVKLAPRARTTLFDAVPNDRLVLALKGTEADFRTTVLSALSARVRRMVEHELNGGEPAAQRDVLEARRTITDLAMEMAGRGEIEINPGGEDEALIR